MLDTVVSLAVCVGFARLSCVRDAASGKVLTMTNNGWFQILFFLLVVLALTKPLGSFMTRVFNREKTFLDPVLRPIEKLVYRLTGVDETKEMRWTEYAGAMLMFSGVTMFVLYLLAARAELSAAQSAEARRRGAGPGVQHGRVLYDQHQLAGVRAGNHHVVPDADGGPRVSQFYFRGGRNRPGHRHRSRHRAARTGHARKLLGGHDARDVLGADADLHFGRAFPGLAGRAAKFQTVRYRTARGSADGADDGLRGKTTTQIVKEQTIAQGPVASQEVIKELGTNGGGFFNTNSAHPYENPTPLTNFVEMVFIFAIGSALTYTLGQMTGSPRHGWAVWCAMAILFLVGVTAAYSAEARGNPLVQTSANHLQPAGNMEGKEVRFGIANSALWAVVTTDTSCGAVNSMHDSFTPLGGMIPLINMLLGEVVFGGVGSGLYGIIVFIILSVFIAGLMVGRTPEYLGKKIEAFDVKMAMLTVLIYPLLVLRFTAISRGLEIRLVEPCKRGTAWTVGNLLRLCGSGREQRLGVRRTQRQYALVQHDASPRRCCSAGFSW